MLSLSGLLTDALVLITLITAACLELGGDALMRRGLGLCGGVCHD